MHGSRIVSLAPLAWGLYDGVSWKQLSYKYSGLNVMPTMRFHIVIKRSCETVYQTLTDLAGYASWLPDSRLYNHTRLTSDYPVRVGTTYVDIGNAVAMQGKVIELEPNKVIVFQQATHEPVNGKRRGLEITVRYELEPAAQNAQETRIIRKVSIHAQGVLLLMLPFLLASIREENQRILKTLKTYLEARGNDERER